MINKYVNKYENTLNKANELVKKQIEIDVSKQIKSKVKSSKCNVFCYFDVETYRLAIVLHTDDFSIDIAEDFYYDEVSKRTLNIMAKQFDETEKYLKS